MCVCVCVCVCVGESRLGVHVCVCARTLINLHIKVDVGQSAIEEDFV